MEKVSLANEKLRNLSGIIAAVYLVKCAKSKIDTSEWDLVSLTIGIFFVYVYVEGDEIGLQSVAKWIVDNNLEPLITLSEAVAFSALTIEGTWAIINYFEKSKDSANETLEINPFEPRNPEGFESFKAKLLAERGTPKLDIFETLPPFDKLDAPLPVISPIALDSVDTKMPKKNSTHKVKPNTGKSSGFGKGMRGLKLVNEKSELKKLDKAPEVFLGAEIKERFLDISKNDSIKLNNISKEAVEVATSIIQVGGDGIALFEGAKKEDAMDLGMKFIEFFSDTARELSDHSVSPGLKFLDTLSDKIELFDKP